MVLFFVMSANSGTILKGPLSSHYGAALYGAEARSLAEDRAAAWSVTPAVFEAAFDARATVLAPSLILVLVPTFALALGLTLWPLGRSGVWHLVLATHTIAALMAWSLIVLVVVSLGSSLLQLSGLEVASIDPVLIPVVILSLIAYLAGAVRRVYRAPRWSAALVGVVLGTAGFAFSFWVFRAVLFALTFATLDRPS